MIRRVKPEDSQRIMEIRNHPRVRNKSNNSEEIDFVKHDQWFNHKYFDSDDNLCFVLERENKVVGYCRLDLDNGSYIISIAIDPDFHGQGLGRQLLGQVLQEVGAGKNILAEIHKDNLSSLKLFKKNYFDIYKEDNQSYYLKYII